jgi:hypothetical protein
MVSKGARGARRSGCGVTGTKGELSIDAGLAGSSRVPSTIRPARALLATGALLAGLAAAAAPGHAAPAYNRQVLVNNLLNPRGLTVDSIGRVLVSEGGEGGTTCDVAGAPPSPPEALRCWGTTGAVGRYDPHHQQLHPPLDRPRLDRPRTQRALARGRSAGPHLQH